MRLSTGEEVFFKVNVSANRMTLVLYSNKSLEEMEEIAKEKFSGIVNKDLPVVSFKNNPFPFPASYKSKFIKFVSVKKSKKMILYFILPSYRENYTQNPMKVLSFILGHEGSGSLLSLLIKKDLAFELYSGDYNYLDMFTSFEVTIQLTEKGFKNYEEVLEIVFEYIQILKTQGVPDYIIQQIKKMNNLNFEFRNNMNGLSKAIELAKLTLRYPYKNMNNFYFLFNGCPQEMIKEALSYLSLESLLMFLSSNEYKDLKEEEPIYKCCYEFEPISSEIKKKIEKITLLKSIKINLINSKKTNSTQISKFQKSIHLFPKILKL